MPATPDRRPGVSDEEGIVLESGPAPTVAGEMRFNGSSFQFRDATGTFDPRTGGSGLTEAQHRALRQLIHFIDEGPADGFASGAYKETLPAGNPFPASIIWWTSAAKTAKIVEKTITRNSNKTPSQIQWKMYDVDGTTVLVTVTDAITYANNVFETSRTRTIA